jgi:ABC-type sulfate/molybdate transport systems ATPase subunit
MGSVVNASTDSPCLEIGLSDVGFHYLLKDTQGFDLDVGTRTIRSGSVIVVYGPNGSGKTTLLRLLARVLEPGRGEVHWCAEGNELVRLALGSNVVVTNNAGPFPHWTVVENLLLGHNDRPSARTTVRGLAAIWGLEGLLQRRPHELSAGQQQRVVLARALGVDATAYLFDEITSAQSESWCDEIGRALRELAARGRIVIAVSHDPVWVSAFADRVLELGAVNSQNTLGATGARFAITYDGPATSWRSEDRRFRESPITP